MFKWVGAVLGFEFGRFLGAAVGFIIGAIIDSYYSRNKSGGGFNPFSGAGAQVSPGDFELDLLSLSSIVIKADGTASQQELDYVRAYFVRTYGKERANATFKTFNEVIKNREVDAARICVHLRSRTPYEVRLQILHFLFGIAMADGQIKSPELNILNRISGYLYIGVHDFESIKAMFYKSADNAYKILEIEKSVTDAEVKKAYRNMVKKYHPDRLSGMDEAYIKGAREKFDKVQEAYDKIRKERGFV